MAILGTPQTAPARLNLTQAFNSLGTTLGPLVGSILILSASELDVAGDASSVQKPYLALAATLFVIAIVMSRFRLPQVSEPEQPTDIPGGDHQVRQRESAWAYRHLVLGAIAIFEYVGAEVSIGSFLVNFMSQPEVGGFSHETAGKYLALYWGGAMVGRFMGVLVLTRIKAGQLLAFNAFVAVLLVLTATLLEGTIAMWTLLAVGLFNSIMFPTIFTLAIESLGRHTGQGSGILCMAIVGGALIPVLQGLIADSTSLSLSFVVPVVCYFYIAWYGAKGHYAKERFLDAQ